MVNIRARIHKRFAQLGRSFFRAAPEEAELLATTISANHASLGAFCHFLQSPHTVALPAAQRIVAQWLNSVIGTLAIVSTVRRKPVVAAPVPFVGSEAFEQVLARASTFAAEIHGLSPAEASQFATCIATAASPTFSFYQRCQSPEDHTLENLAASLVAFVEGAAPYAAGAQQLLQCSQTAAV